MKKGEVPQDKVYMQKGKIRDLCYVVDDNGEYTTELSLGWDPKNDAITQAWSDINEKLEKVILRLIDGKTSPVEYYMVKNIMNTGMLSKYTGIRKWQIRRHFKPSVFAGLPDGILENYASTFKISVEQLRNPLPEKSKS